MTVRYRRWLLAVLALALAAGSVADYLAWRREIARLEVVLRKAGTAERSPEVLRDLARFPGRVRARLRAARALLADELALRFRPDNAADTTAELSRVRLATARRLASEGLPGKTVSWQAELIIGAANYLELSRIRNARVAALPELWEKPLRRATELAPGQAEPLRFLAAAYLSQWSGLSDHKRGEATAVIARALEDESTFDLLYPFWLRQAPTLEEAFGALPEDPDAWRKVSLSYARGEDWERFCMAHERREELLLDELASRLDQAGRRLRRGDHPGGRALVLSVLRAAPVSPEFAPVVATALALAPPGSLALVPKERYREWLDWTIDRCLVEACPFEPPLLLRLAAAVGSLSTADEAFVAMAAGDLHAAERIARLDPQVEDDWAAFHLLKARWHRRRSELDAARMSLAAVAPSFRNRPAYLAETRQLAEAARSPTEIARATTALAAAGRTSWTAEAWLSRGSDWKLELVAARAATGLGVALGGRGAAVALRLDNSTLGCFPAPAGAVLVPSVEIEPGAHVLEILPLAGGRFTPGATRLR